MALLKTAKRRWLIRYELGLNSAGDYKVRVPLSANVDGSLNFGCEIREGTAIRIMKGEKENQISSAREAATLRKR